MRSLLIIVCCLLHLSHKAQPTLSCKSPDDLRLEEQHRFGQRLLKTQSNAGINIDVNYHRLILKVDPTQYGISGNVTTIFTHLDSTNQVSFDFSSNMLVDSVRYKGSTVIFDHTGNILNIFFPSKALIGSIDSLQVFFQGLPANIGFGSFSYSNRNGDPLLWSLSEPYGAKEWWPCKESLKDKIDSVDLLISCPDGFRVASNGLLVDTSNVFNGFREFHWKHRYPIDYYLIGIAVGPYHLFEDKIPLSQNDSVLLQDFVLDEFLPDRSAITAQTKDLLQLFDSLLGPYPFKAEKYGHAICDFNGGMEHQTMSFMKHFDFNLTAHELAHHWFGNKITCGTWKDLWLNEGFASYCEILANEFLSSKTAANYRKSWIFCPPRDSYYAVYVDDTTDVRRLFNIGTYGKGAVILNMLRLKIGDGAFFRAIRNYLADPKLAYSTATSPDFIAHINAVAPFDCDPYFNRWLYGVGHPKYLINSHSTEDSITLEIQQELKNGASDYFELVIPIQFSGKDSTYVVYLEHQGATQRYTLPTPEKILAITFDPYHDLLAESEINLVVGHEEVNKRSTWEVYPNPFDDAITISNLAGSSSSYFLKDLSGKTIASGNITGIDFVLVTSNLPSSLYLLTLENFQSTQTLLLRKQ